MGRVRFCFGAPYVTISLLLALETIFPPWGSDGEAEKREKERIVSAKACFPVCLLVALGLGAGLPAAENKAPGAEAKLERARLKAQAGKYDEALELLEQVGEGGSGRTAAEAWFRRGEILRSLGREEEALEAYNRVLELRPAVDLLKRSLERKYQLGLDFLQGKAKRYFLGFISYRSSAFGVQILDELVRNYPFESFSDDALYSIGNYYFRTGQWEEARPVYERLIDSYPRSEWVPPAYFQLGKAIYNEIKGYKYDPTPLSRSRWYFERFLEKRRVGPEAEQARRYIRELRDMEARHELYIARFYLRNDCRKGALIYLESAVRKGRTLDGELTEGAKKAQEELARLAKEK